MVSVTTRTETAAQPKTESRWLPVIIFGLFYLTLWHPPGLPIVTWQWHTMLFVAGLVYLLQALPPKPRIARLYILVRGLILVGGLISLIRTTDFYLGLYNLVGAGITFVTFLLFSQVLFSRRNRARLLGVVFVVTVLWGLQIWATTIELGDRARYEFVGNIWDKNYNTLLFSLATTGVLGLAAFWQPVNRSSMTRLLIRGLLLALAFLLVFTASLLYSRSGMVAIVIGAIGVMVMAILQSGRKGALTRIIVILLLAVIVVLFVQVSNTKKVETAVKQVRQQAA